WGSRTPSTRYVVFACSPRTCSSPNESITTPGVRKSTCWNVALSPSGIVSIWFGPSVYVVAPRLGAIWSRAKSRSDVTNTLASCPPTGVGAIACDDAEGDVLAAGVGDDAVVGAGANSCIVGGGGGAANIADVSG